MRRLLLVSILISAVFLATAQETKYFSNSDVLFNQGKEFYNQRKYAASYRSFEAFVRKTPMVNAGQLQEAGFYIAANAYYLKQKDAPTKMRLYLVQHPYTPFADLANFMLGMMDSQAKDYKNALLHFNKVNENRLGRYEKVDYLFSKGFACIQTKNFNDALTIFKRLKDMKTRYDLAATYYYAYSEYTLGNYAAALPEFLKIEDNPAYKNLVPYYIIQIYYYQKKFDELNGRAETLLKNNPSNPANAEIYRIMGEIAYGKKDYPKAISNLKQYEKLAPQTLRNDMYMLGLSLYNQSKFAESIQYLSKITTDKDELSENAYLHIGNSYIKTGDKTNARLAFEAALNTNFNPGVREEAMFNYALTSFETTSAFGESITAFERFLTEFPNSKHNDKAQNYLASAYFSSKNYQTSIESINKIKNPNARVMEAKQYVLYQLGTEAFTQQDNVKAIDYFTQSLRISSSGKYSAECLYWRSEAYYRTSMPDKSVDDLNAFFANTYSRNSVNLKIANYNMAYAYFSQKKYGQAIDWFQKYIRMETNKSATTYPDALNRVGDCFFAERNFNSAETYYAQAVAANPANGDYAMFQSAYVAGLQKNYTAKASRLESLLAKFPKSEYADEAMYETGRAYLMLDNEQSALSWFKKLLSTYTSSSSARKGALEIGMIYFNNNNFDEAITAYKKVILLYPGSEESYTALESLEAVYIEKNDVSSYLAYTKTLNMKIAGNSAQREDSISFIAAEKQYMNAKYQQAISGLRSYLTSYCPGGRHCTTAQYYLADSYYRSNDKAAALSAYDALLRITGNEYMLEAATRCAEISYDNKDYEASLRYFKQMETLAQGAEKLNNARLGVLRCSYFLNDHQTTIKVATDIVADQRSDAAVKTEARYNRAKAYLATNQHLAAVTDLKAVSVDTRTETGAEANYLLANLYFEQNNLKTAEDEIMAFAKKNTPHQFWLARSFVLLSDIYIKQNNDFQAKQYLLSLQKNYTTADEIQTMINERLQAIAQRENKAVTNQ
ncbi:MAG: tetratricopeptide repeat protein [Paludibacter sp.]